MILKIVLKLKKKNFTIKLRNLKIVKVFNSIFKNKKSYKRYGK